MVIAGRKTPRMVVDGQSPWLKRLLLVMIYLHAHALLKPVMSRNLSDDHKTYIALKCNCFCYERGDIGLELIQKSTPTMLSIIGHGGMWWQIF